MEHPNIKANIANLLDKATEKQLRLIYLVAYEIVRKPSEK